MFGILVYYEIDFEEHLMSLFADKKKGWNCWTVAVRETMWADPTTIRAIKNLDDSWLVKHFSPDLLTNLNWEINRRRTHSR